MTLMPLQGPNFSGRTDHLRFWAGLGDATPTSNGIGAYIGPDPLAALSGLAPTVRTEIEFAAADAAAMTCAMAMVEDLGFAYILARNPFTLSGGEQVIAAMAAALALRPNRLAIDCALEQLAETVRHRLVTWLETLDLQVTVADNRLGEWYDGPLPEPRAPTKTAPVVIAPDLFGPSASGTIEVIDLCFAYPRGAKVFDGLTVSLESGGAYRLDGPNGSGKSTFSRILTGLLKPQSGEVRIDGKRIEPWRTPGKLASYHFQNPSFQIFGRTIAAQLAKSRDATAMAHSFGIDAAVDGHPLDLPFVLRKRLALATAFAAQAPLLVLDEPTLGQDDDAARGVSDAATSRACLIVSHSKIYESLPTIIF